MTRYTHKLPASIDRRNFIHLAGLGTMGALVLGLDVSVGAQKRPNFIFMVSDDQGWDGLSVQMHDIMYLASQVILMAMGKSILWIFSNLPELMGRRKPGLIWTIADRWILLIF